MSFISADFLIFLGILLPVYFLSGKIVPKYQWLCLLAASIYFYASAVGYLSVYLGYVVLLSWLFAYRISNRQMLRDNIISRELTKDEKRVVITKTQKKNSISLCVYLILVLSVLVFLKCRKLFQLPMNGAFDRFLIMPLGLSFFLFLGISYVVDVYRETITAERNILKCGLYILYFPHISQGPLDRYNELAPQLFETHAIVWRNIKYGAERIILGYFKKIIIANNLGNFVNSIYSEPSQFSGMVLAFATLMYALQLYADFSGYMDIACGISECLGIRLTENFKTPYFSESIAEYWRRWHISLGAWFKDYLYYPILRSNLLSKLSKKIRKSGHKKLAQNITTAIGLSITWLLIGFWHGTADHYIAHGLFHGFFVILAAVLGDVYSTCRTKLHISEQSKGWKCFRILRTFFLVNIGYVMFRADSFSEALLIYSRILTKNFYFGWSAGLFNPIFDRFFWICVLSAVVFCFVMEILEEREGFFQWLNRQVLPLRWMVIYCMLVPVICVVLFSNVQETAAGNFLYFNF